MIRFVMTAGHAYTVAQVLRDPEAPACDVLLYDELLAARRLPRAVYVFTDFDRLGPWDLELAAAAAADLARAGLPVLNDPARAAGRFALLRRLHEAGLNDFNAYRAHEGVRPARYPVFLRRDWGHRHPLSDLLPDWDAVRRALDALAEGGVPLANVLLVEYCGEEVAPGLFRKLSLGRVGAAWVPQLCGHQDHWAVKRGGPPGNAPPELYEDELRILRENPYAEALAPAFHLAHLDYGRADFALVGGRVQVYEINTNPHVPRGGRHPVPLRLESFALAWRRWVEALWELDARAPAPGPPVPLGDPRLRPVQGRGHRTRPLP